MFECIDKKEYSKLFVYTVKVLTDKHKKHIDPRDVIHDSIIVCFDKKVEYSFDVIRKIICHQIQVSNVGMNELNADGKTFVGEGIFSGIEMKYCKGCQQVLPVAFFRIQNILKYGSPSYRCDCKKCEYEKRREYLSKQKEIDPEIILRTKSYQSKYRKQRKEVINKNVLLKEHFATHERERAKKDRPKRREYFIEYARNRRARNKIINNIITHDIYIKSI